VIRLPAKRVMDVPEIASDLQNNVEYLNERLGLETNWDIIAKPFRFGNIRMMSYVTNGFFTTINMVNILSRTHECIRNFEQERGGSEFAISELVEYLTLNIPFVQVQTVKSMDEAVHFILSGPLVAFLDGFSEALLIDTRIYPMRSISEPEIERTIRGGRDGFTETLLINTSLLRRRIRDARLRDELYQVGSVSQTDVGLLYLEGVAPKAVVDQIRDRLKSIQTDEIFMTEQSLVEHLADVKWNPYPIVRYTERPDVAATALSEGQVVILVDTSPEAIIAPATMFHHLQHPEEYHSYPFIGTYVRWVILLAVFLSVFLPGVFLMMNSHPEMMPEWLAFFKADQSDPLPLWAELVLSGIGLDLMRLAIINTPKGLSSSVGIVAALLFGQFAAKIHLLQPEVLVYMGLVMIAQFATSSYELGTANQIARYWVILWTSIFHTWGFLLSTVLWLVFLVRTRSFGVPYLWPLIPFRWKHGLREVLFRYPMQKAVNRPHIPLPEQKEH
jgi:stage V sporulation protein AF